MRRRAAALLILPLLLAAATACGSDDGGGSADGASGGEQVSSVLQVRSLVSVKADPVCATPAPVDISTPQKVAVCDREGRRVVLSGTIVTGDQVASATAESGPSGAFVAVQLDQEGTAALRTATTAAVDAKAPANQLALIVNGQLVAAPVVKEPITTGQLEVSAPSQIDAEQLAQSLS